MKKIANVCKISFIVIVMLMIVLPFVFINRDNNAVSHSENRVLKSFPEEWDDFKDFAKQFEDWLSDNIGFRDELLLIRTNIMFDGLGIVTSESVHKGLSDWYYYTNEENLQIATGEYTLSEKTLKKILENHIAIRDKLAQKGIDYVIVMPTSKVSIYPEFLGFGEGKICETPVDIVADYIESNSDLRVIRLKEALIEEKENNQVFFKNDTHWNERGAYCAYRKIITDLNNWNLIRTAPIDVNFLESEYIGEFGNMLGNQMLLGKERTEVMDTSKFKAEKITNDKYYQLSSMLSQEGLRYPWYYYYNSTQKSEPSAMFFGDSMFGSWNITEVMAENFSEFTYVWSYDLFEKSIDIAQPDIVFYEMTERFLNQFPNKNQVFLSEKINEYSARIDSIEYSGNDLIVNVTNDSVSKWSEKDLIRCCLWFNNEDWSMRSYIEDDREILPGETVSFMFNDVKRYFNDDIRVEVQMLQEGNVYFGDRKPVNY